MHYLLAIIGAVAGALTTTLFLSGRVANWFVATKSFDSPDQVSNTEDLIFLLTSLLGLVVGWLVGWAIANAMFGEDDFSADEPGS